MKKRMGFLLIGYLTIIINVRADDPMGGYFDGIEINCPELPSEAHGRLMCSTSAYEKADKELNALYKKFLQLADNNQRKYLQDMQKGWIKIKKAQCDLFNSYHYDHYDPTLAVGSTKWSSYCEAAMTIRRVEELKKIGTGIIWKSERK